MSSRGGTSRGKPKILVDTSFLLPALGVEVEKEVMEAVKEFYRFEVYYLEVSLLEAMWKILKVAPPGVLNRVREGLVAIFETYRQAKLPPEAYIDAYKLYREGHRDYIDNLLYATSLRLNIPLLTVDRELIEFLKRGGYPVDNVLTPEKLKRYP